MRAAAWTALLLLGGPAVAWAQTSPFLLTAHADFEYIAGDPVVGVAGFQGGKLLAGGEYRLADRLSVFAELDARARTGGVRVALDRIAVRWAARDDLALSVGRLHSPVSYWTNAFAPGGWNRTSATAPALADPDAGILPHYIVGLRADARAAAGPVELAPTVVYANGRDSGLSSADADADFDGQSAWALALAVRPLRIPGLSIGGALYDDRVRSFALRPVDERIATAHVAYDRGPLEAAIEYALIERVADSVSHRSRGFYAQLAYRLPEHQLRLMPYVRFERLDMADDDPTFLVPPAPALDRRGIAIGVRHDVLPMGALKAELRSERASDGDRLTALHLAATFRVAWPGAEPATIVAAPPPSGPAGSAAPDSAGTGAGDAAAKAATDAATDGRAPRPETRPAGRQAPAPRGALAAAPGQTGARPAGIAIVVHPATPATDVSLPELRRIFRGEQSTWPGGEPIVLLVRTPLPVERDVVLGRIFQMNETELRQFWLERIFRDATATGPRVVSDPDTARRLVASLPGAISFLPADQVPPELRVLRVDGKLPGEPGYPLQ